MSQYYFTQEAQQDLIKIRKFTFNTWGSEQSTAYLRNLKKTLQLLTEMPSMGINCKDSLGDDIYRFPFVSHTIYYTTLPNNKIVIIAILHQGMVPEIHISNRI